MHSSHLHRRAGSGGWLLSIAVLASLTGFPASARDGITANLLTSLEPAAPSVMADFDGDNKLDLATLSSPDINFHQIRVQFNSSQSPVFTFLIRPAANHLSARDLDGDNDRDLVLETALRVPLAVWINDGSGNFQPGDLDKFRFLLLHDDRRSLAPAERLLPSLRTSECPRRSVVLSQPSGCGLELASGRFADNRLAQPGSVRHFDIWTRGPPRRS